MLTKIKNKEFDSIYNLMEISFPIDEYRPYKLQKDLLKNKKYSIYATKNDNNTIKAFIAIWNFDEFIYVEHLAVYPQYRNEGLGSKILNELSNKYKKMICLEVEPPDNEMANRRINFYQRNKFFFNDYFYMQPPMSEGKNKIQLYIMTTKNKIDELMFKTIKNKLYLEVYKYSLED